MKRRVRVRRNCNVFNLAMENVLIGKIRDQLSRHHTQMHFKSNEMYTFLNHFQICEIVEMIDRFPVYIQTMQSCSSMFDTVFRDRMTKTCMQFHVCTIENDVIHVHCKRSFLVAMVACDFDIIIFF